MTAESPLIEASGLCKRYGPKAAVKDLTLRLTGGGVLGLLGRNGAGKTTTMRLLAGLIPPSSGTANVLGRAAIDLRPQERAQMGYVSENMQLPVWMTVSQMLRFLRPLYSTWDLALEARLIKLLALPLDQPMKSFSRGTLMKAAFLAALAYRPKVLLLDEPFSGLDSQVREDLVDALLDLTSESHWAVVLSSHDMDDVERLVDRIAWIDEGELQFDEEVSTLEGRSREVSFHLPEAVSAPPWPATWLHPRRRGRLVTAVESRFTDEDTLRDRIISWSPQVEDIQVSVIGMRRIYLAYLRSE